jgi:hypothetical protein
MPPPRHRSAATPAAQPAKQHDKWRSSRGCCLEARGTSHGSARSQSICDSVTAAENNVHWRIVDASNFTSLRRYMEQVAAAVPSRRRALLRVRPPRNLTAGCGVVKSRAAEQPKKKSVVDCEQAQSSSRVDSRCWLSQFRQLMNSIELQCTDSRHAKSVLSGGWRTFVLAESAAKTRTVAFVSTLPTVEAEMYVSLFRNG